MKYYYRNITFSRILFTLLTVCRHTRFIMNINGFQSAVLTHIWELKMWLDFTTNLQIKEAYRNLKRVFHINSTHLHCCSIVIKIDSDVTEWWPWNRRESATDARISRNNRRADSWGAQLCVWCTPSQWIFSPHITRIVGQPVNHHYARSWHPANIAHLLLWIDGAWDSATLTTLSVPSIW